MTRLSDDLFPFHQKEEEDGVRIGGCMNDLLDAIETWFHAQQSASPITVGMAAKTFNVSPQLVWDGFQWRGNPFFWVSDEDKPLEECHFEIDGV
ncbi:hypothetical protein [Pseudophaeobacter sp.]|jgi:hypothetical protein|uniref:hypothetical protein n=1 Tax=Pseudophaeobacter sp. TaxID=1971739 RepID=UPI0032D97CB7